MSFVTMKVFKGSLQINIVKQKRKHLKW